MNIARGDFENEPPIMEGPLIDEPVRNEPVRNEDVNDPGKCCYDSPPVTNILVNALLHMLILGSILTAFYFIVISDIGSKTFRTQLRNNIVDNLAPAIINNDEKTNFSIGPYLKNINFKQLKKAYENDSDATINQNKWVKKVAITVLIMIAIMIVIIVALLLTFCKKVPIFAILRENIILFTMVGIVEIAFFLQIAKRFIPTKPSIIMDTVVESIRKNLSD
jgi:hypothetical protein